VPDYPGVAANGHTVIGRALYQRNQVDFFAGAIDDVRVYDRAPSAAEIRALGSHLWAAEPRIWVMRSFDPTRLGGHEAAAGVAY
jgi:hypothetical protein